jgi:primary-amine oxidase
MQLLRVTADPLVGSAHRRSGLRLRRPGQQTPRVTHPLDPLSADEFRHAAALLRRERGVARPGWRIAGIMLREPAKDVVRAHRPGDAVDRAARAVVWSTTSGTAHIASSTSPATRC